MTTVEYKGKSVELLLNMYALREFGMRMNAETPRDAMERLRDVMQSKGLSFDSMDVIAALFFTMHETAAKVANVEPVMRMEEAYDVLLDTNAFKGMIEEINIFMPDPDTIKKNAVKEVEKVKA